MNRSPLFICGFVALSFAQIFGAGSPHPNRDDLVERLVYFEEPQRDDILKLNKWRSALAALPDVNARLLELVSRDYETDRHWRLLGSSLFALSQRTDLSSQQLQWLTSRLSRMKSPDPARSTLEIAFIAGGISVIRNYPSPQHEELALSFLNDTDSGVFISAVKTLAEIGEKKALLTAKEVISERQERAKGMTDPILNLLKPQIEKIESKLNAAEPEPKTPADSSKKEAIVMETNAKPGLIAALKGWWFCVALALGLLSFGFVHFVRRSRSRHAQKGGRR